MLGSQGPTRKEAGASDAARMTRTFRPMRPGDKVRLATGGPLMTVDMAPVHMAFVHWYVGDRTQDGLFPQEELVLVEAVREDTKAGS